MVQRKRLHSRPRIVVGDKSVEQARAAGRPKGLDDGQAVQGGYQTAAKRIKQRGARIGAGYSVVMLHRNVRLPDNLI